MAMGGGGRSGNGFRGRGGAGRGRGGPRCSLEGKDSEAGKGAEVPRQGPRAVVPDLAVTADKFCRLFSTISNLILTQFKINIYIDI